VYEEDLGLRLKLLRIARQIQQKDLAEKIGIPARTLSAVERGHRPMDQFRGYTLLKLANCLGCTTDYLLGHVVEGGIPGAC
jgi:transcriptional regulator with XRE-family HTH domain